MPVDVCMNIHIYIYMYGTPSKKITYLSDKFMFGDDSLSVNYKGNIYIYISEKDFMRVCVFQCSRKCLF